MSRWIEIDDKTVVATARRLARQAAIDLGLPQTRAEEIAIVASEAASNALRHGKEGRVLVEKTMTHAGSGLALVVADNGDGIPALDAAMADGTSRSGSAGLGLGAMRRLSDEFAIWTEPDRGTVVTCAFNATPDKRQSSPVQFAGLTCCLPSERVCGDHWTARQDSSGVQIMLCDGLGHGPAAAQEAQDLAAAYTSLDGEPGPLLSRLSHQLTNRRGAVAAAIKVEPETRTLHYGGVGNISTFLVRKGQVKRFPVRDGRIGGPPLTAFSETKGLQRGDVVVLHSDGLSTIRARDINMSLFSRSPLTIAATLLHTNLRGRDDASIAVLRFD